MPPRTDPRGLMSSAPKHHNHIALSGQGVRTGTQEAERGILAYDGLSGQGKAMLGAYYASAASPTEQVTGAIMAALAESSVRVSGGKDDLPPLPSLFDQPMRFRDLIQRHDLRNRNLDRA